MSERTRTIKRGGLPRITSHELRHTFGTQMIRLHPAPKVRYS
jgi:integrase